MSEKGVFEIGLVGAGAISAGAYTGGVVDFLVQALDAWYARKAQGDVSVPPHEVKLSVFAGASAGGMTAAMAAGFLGSDQLPIQSESDADSLAARNKLFDCWVRRIDIQGLLGRRDLPTDASRVVSLLDSSILKDIADVGFDVTPRAARRPYVADDFHVLLTVTNLRGVPYRIPLVGSATQGHVMLMHADHLHFCFNDSGTTSREDLFCMGWQDLGPGGSRPMMVELLKLGALSSGAFPIGLAPRTILHLLTEPGMRDLYSSRLWPVPEAPEEGEPCQCVSLKSIQADWRSLPDFFPYRFHCVDGGVMNNEPLDLARRILTRGEGHNPRSGDAADRAAVLIDPFPGPQVFEEDYDPTPPDLLKTFTTLFSAMKAQARFKPDELMLASDENIYSRFLISPRRGNSPYPIACGSLGGFGGFLKEAFRRHDYFLGRRNAQKFLRHHFCLPENNVLFTHFGDWWTEERKQQYGHRHPVTHERFLPVIPLVDGAARECFEPAWPSYSAADLQTLRGRIKGRTRAVLAALIAQYLENTSLVIRMAIKLFAKTKEDEIVQYIAEQIEEDLKRMGLMR
jgi:hypothetical protein